MSNIRQLTKKAWADWYLPIKVPAGSWLWTEMHDLAFVPEGEGDYLVVLKLTDNEVSLVLPGAVTKRGRLILLPWEK